MSARSSMIHRAKFQRDTNTLRDADGAKGPPVWRDLDEVPCRYWADTGRMINGPTINAEIVTHSMIVPRGTDVVIGDRVTTITDRKTPRTELVRRTMSILSIEPRRDHLALELQEVGP